MKYTDLEINVIKCFGSFTNYDTLEDNLNDNCTCLDVVDISKLTGYDVKTVKGIIGSLTKKRLVFVDEFNINQTALMVTDEGIREYYKLIEEKGEENMVRAIERETGIEYNVKKIEGGFEVYTLEGEKYKKLKDSTFKRYFKPVKNTEAKEEEPAPKAEKTEKKEKAPKDTAKKAKAPVTDDDFEDVTPDEPKATQKTKEEKAKKPAKEEKKVQPVIELDGVTRENMVEKIKKLLNLSENNPSVEEATSAVLMAQKLMAKYNIHEDEVTLEEIKEDEIGYTSAVLKDDSSLHLWRKNLGTIVAKNFRVKAYMMGKDVTFRGFKDDVKLAVEVFAYLYALGNKLGSKKYHEQLAETGSGKNVYNSFVAGFLHGVEEALNEQCTALMLVTPKAVEEDWKIFVDTKCKGKGQKGLSEVRSGKFYEEGKVEGKAAVKSKQLDTKKNKGGK